MNTIEEETFTSKNIEVSELSGNEFQNCRFEGLDLSDSSLKGSKFLDCVFLKCNLSNASLLGVSFRETRFESSKMMGVNFTSCNGLSDISFTESVLDFSVFQGLEVLNFSAEDSSFKEADLSGAKLLGASFRKCNLHNANLNGSDLRGADFRDAINYQINPEYTKVKKAKFSMPEAMGLLSGFEVIIE